jgi:pimeloyl-ACP methyl ester carboxylesterase
MNTRTAQTYFQTPTEVVSTADGVNFAYRRLGPGGDVPPPISLSNMDDWDPLIVDGLASDREVITFDYPGLGGSTGVTPTTVPELTASGLDFLRVLDLTTVDFLGFSLNGMVAQQMARAEADSQSNMIVL